MLLYFFWQVVLPYGTFFDEMINTKLGKIVMGAEMINTKLGKIVMHAEHEIRNFCFQNRAELEIRNFCSQNCAEHEIRQNHAEHEIRNFCLQNLAEQVSNSIMPSVINEVLNLINS